MRNRGPRKDLNDSTLIVYEFKWFPWLSKINFIPFRIFRGPLFHKSVIGQELFFAASYSKPALPYQQNNTLLMMVDRDVGSALGRAQLLADQEVKNSIYARIMSSVEIGVKNWNCRQFFFNFQREKKIRSKGSTTLLS